MKTNLKLFVWTGFSPDYSGGLAFAIASDETDARDQVCKACGYLPNDWGKLEIKRIDRRFAAYVNGGG